MHNSDDASFFISADIDNYNWQAGEEGYKYPSAATEQRSGGLGGGGGNLHVGKGLTGEDGSSQPLSTSQHLVLIVGDDFHRITEIRDRKDLLGHLAQLSASIELFSVRKTTSLFSQKALILSNGFPTEDGFKWTPEVKELKNY